MKYIKYLLAAAVIAGLMGCDLLDSQEPQQSLPTDEVIEDPAGLENLVTGMYDGLQNGNISGGNFNVLPEIMTNNVNWTGSFTNYARQASKNMQPDDGQIENWWDISYREINTANVLLGAIEDVDDPTFTDADRELIRAEAHFIRGMLLFELARVYAKPWGFTADNSHPAVPVRLDGVEAREDFENLSRESLADVFAQAEEDLAIAADLLPDTGVRADQRATRYAALGYLKRLYLERGDYDMAGDYAAQIIESGLFSLTETPGGPFENEFSSESIFEIIHTPQDNPGVNLGQNAFYTDTDRGGRGDIQFTSDYTAALEATVTEEQQAEIAAAGLNVFDTRNDLLDRNPDLLSTLKFTDGVNNADNVMNLRYAAVLLSRAETLVETAASIGDVPQEAFDHLNNVRTRSIEVTDEDGVQFNEMIEFEPGDFASTEEMMDAILLERRVELSFEGDRFYTLKRKGMEIDGLQPDDDRITFPIPQGEMDANPNIEQNPGY